MQQEKALFFDDLGSVYPPPKDDQDSKAYLREHILIVRDPLLCPVCFFGIEEVAHNSLNRVCSQQHEEGGASKCRNLSFAG